MAGMLTITSRNLPQNVLRLTLKVLEPKNAQVISDYSANVWMFEWLDESQHHSSWSCYTFAHFNKMVKAYLLDQLYVKLS